MAITFLEKRKRLRYFVPVLIITILVTAFVIWQGFFVQEGLPVAEEIVEIPIKKIKIDFQVLKNPIFEDLQPFEEIPPFEVEIGRENPFLPY